MVLLALTSQSEHGHKETNMASLVVSGDTSGSVTLSAPAVAGTTTITLPNTTGTMALTSQIVTPTGTLIRAPQTLTSGTSYTTPAGCNNILIEIIGASGGSGGTNLGTGSFSGAGGSAPYAVKYAAVSPNTAYTYAIGAGGTAGAAGNNAGGAGGTTSITIGGTTYSVSGGGAGSGVNGSSITGTAGSSGTATNMDSSITPIASSGRTGGAPTTPFITGTPFITNSGAGTTYGGGAGGTPSSAGSVNPGSVGFQGLIRITEYA